MQPVTHTTGPASFPESFIIGSRRVVKSDPVMMGRNENEIGERDFMNYIISLLLIFSNLSCGS
jgi:hypothetical protein